MATVNRRDRFIDLAALLLIVAGVALYVDGTARLRAIALLSYRHPGARGIRQLDVADRARYESNGGIALVVLGAVVGVVSATSHARRKRELHAVSQSGDQLPG
jgi:hypothetical protein